MRKRRVFTPEFRAEAVPLALEGERPSSESARELGIRPDQLRHWKQQLTESTERPAAGETPEQELRRLRRENPVLRQEQEFLKKAAAFFAKGSR